MIYILYLHIVKKILYLLMDICKLLKKAWRNYTWFSMVAMHGEKGDKRFKEIYTNNKI